MIEPRDLNAEELKLFYERLDRLKNFIGWKLNPMIADCALEVAKAYFGGKLGLVKKILANSAEWRKELTPEDIAEMELIEKEEIEHDLADFTPNLENPMYQDDVWIAQWLLSEAVTGGDFDEVFENIMANRYEKTLMSTIDGETQVWRRVRTIEEHESILV
jgi:hypothetical protein